jgi:ubiquinone/menaquinone biosynthesis C-methylase UbiE
LLRQRVARLTAIEIDPRLAHALQRRLADTNVRVIEGDASKMRLESKAFSSAVAMTMLHHVPSPTLQDKLFAEVYRILQPGGVFAGTDNTGGPRFCLIHLGDIHVTVDPATLSQRLAAAGFGHIRIDRLGQRFRFRAIRQPD